MQSSPHSSHRDDFAVIRAELKGLGQEAYGREIPETSGTAAAIRRLDRLEEQLEAAQKELKLLAKPNGASIANAYLGLKEQLEALQRAHDAWRERALTAEGGNRVSSPATNPHFEHAVNYDGTGLCREDTDPASRPTHE